MKIVNTAHVASTDATTFTLNLQKTIEGLQAGGYKVEVQYSAAGLSHYQNVNYSALLIARKP